MEIVNHLKYFILTLVIVLGSCTYVHSCDSLKSIDLDKVYNQFIGNQFSSIFFELEKCKPFNSKKINWPEGCDKCQLATILEGTIERDSIHFAFAGMDYMTLRQNGLYIAPSKIGIRRIAYSLGVKSNTLSNIEIEFSIRPNILLSFHLFDQSGKTVKEFVDYGQIRLNSYFFHFSFLGCLFIVALINFVTFFFSRRKDILFYGIYASVVLIYFAAIFLSMQGFIGYDMGRAIEFMSQPLMYIGYIYFMKYFIETKKNYPFLDKIYNISIAIFWFIFTLITFSLISSRFGMIAIVYDGYRVIAGLGSLWVIYYLFRNYSKIIGFLITGHVAVTIGSLMSMFFTIYGIRIGYLRPIHWMMIGITIELITFSAGIGYRTYLNNKEKIKLQRALINEMQKNESLMVARETELNEKVEAATLQVLKEEKEKLVAEFSLQKKEIELSLLRNQMNPHFIFNSLNSIKSFIIKNQPRIAGEFLTKFATLMRLILSNSKEAEVPLSREIQTVTLYMELEQIRLMNKFSFEFNIEESVGAEDVMVQPLILQPFIENSIWHGIRHKEEDGLIRVNVSYVDDGLLISIMDDGIGRVAASNKENNSLSKNKSYGMEITNERLKKYYKEGFKMSVNDLHPSSNETGTVVRLHLPIKKTINA